MSILHGVYILERIQEYWDQLSLLKSFLMASTESVSTKQQKVSVSYSHHNIGITTIKEGNNKIESLINSISNLGQ